MHCIIIIGSCIGLYAACVSISICRLRYHLNVLVRLVYRFLQEKLVHAQGSISSVCGTTLTLVTIISFLQLRAPTALLPMNMLFIKTPLDWILCSREYARGRQLDRCKKMCTPLASGIPCLLRTLEKGFLIQVSTMMQATDKVSRSAYLPRLAAPPKPLSSQSLEQAETSNPVEGTQDLDKECYTDADCYQQLLKEFLESRGTGLSQEVAFLKHKKRPNTRDRRASKGRRFRYNVQVLHLQFTWSAMLLEAFYSATPPMHANMLLVVSTVSKRALTTAALLVPEAVCMQGRSLSALVDVCTYICDMFCKSLNSSLSTMVWIQYSYLEVSWMQNCLLKTSSSWLKVLIWSQVACRPDWLTSWLPRDTRNLRWRLNCSETYLVKGRNGDLDQINSQRFSKCFVLGLIHESKLLWNPIRMDFRIVTRSASEQTQALWIVYHFKHVHERSQFSSFIIYAECLSTSG